MSEIKMNPHSQAVSQRKVPEPYKKLARSMETQFAEFLIQQMKNTVEKSEPDSSAVQYYNSLMDHEHAKYMAQQGLGLQKVILNQIYPQGNPQRTNGAIEVAQREARDEHNK